MSTRKILSAMLASALVGSSLLPGITHAAIDFWGTKFGSGIQSSGNYAPPKKVQRFLWMENKVLDYMTQDYKRTVMKLKNTNAKQSYTAEYADIREDVKNVFSNARYSSDYMLPYYMDALKKEIGTYKTLRNELVLLNGSSNNPFSIPAQETASVENDVTGFQKILTTAMRQALDNYDSSDFKETGKMNMTAEGDFGKVDLSIEKYTKILSLLTRSQEADMTAKATFSFNMPGSYEYNKKTDDYEKTPGKTVSGELSIDGSMKVIDQDLYLTLRNYSVNTNLTGEEKDNLDKSLKEFAQYKGKTVKISLPSSSGKAVKINQAEIISQLKKTLAILEQNSLFTPYKKIGDTYTLTLKDSTIESIGAVYDQKTSPADIAQAKKAMRKAPLFYTVASGKNTLFTYIDGNSANGTASLSKQDGEYSFLLDIHNPKDRSEKAYLLVKKDFVEGRLQTSDINASIDYKNKTLSLTAQGYMQNAKIEGPLSEENANLNFTFNGKKVGNVTWKKVADTYTYDVLFETTLMEAFSKFHMNGESTVTKGNFPIVAPKDVVEIRDFSKTKTDTWGDAQRIKDMYVIQWWVQSFYIENDKFPKSLNDIPLSFLGYVRKDPKEGQNINGCVFGYRYTTSPDAQEYSLSTCLEEKNNIETYAKNDGGTDPLRWEIHWTNQ